MYTRDTHREEVKKEAKNQVSKSNSGIRDSVVGFSGKGYLLRRCRNPPMPISFPMERNAKIEHCVRDILKNKKSV